MAFQCAFSLRPRSPSASSFSAYYSTTITISDLCRVAMASSRSEPLSIETLLQKQKAEKEAAAKVRAFITLNLQA